jgi:hypothetical protein
VRHKHYPITDAFGCAFHVALAREAGPRSSEGHRRGIGEENGNQCTTSFPFSKPAYASHPAIDLH